MPTCRICLHTFKAIKFQTKDIEICGRCVGTLNESPEPAKNAEDRLTELLARGMRRNAERDLTSDEEWKRRKAQWTLDNFDAALAAALPGWLNRLLAKSENSTHDFKIMRAHRRGLLRMEGFADYPSGDVWARMARRIRARDRNRCTSCETTDAILDVHHIVYLSNHGANQQSNLITLCRPCHETEHGREFDLPESSDPESLSPIRWPAIGTHPSPTRAPAQPTQPIHTPAPTLKLEPPQSQTPAPILALQPPIRSHQHNATQPTQSAVVRAIHTGTLTRISDSKTERISPPPLAPPPECQPTQSTMLNEIIPVLLGLLIALVVIVYALKT